MFKKTQKKQCDNQLTNQMEIEDTMIMCLTLMRVAVQQVASLGRIRLLQCRFNMS